MLFYAVKNNATTQSVDAAGQRSTTVLSLLMVAVGVVVFLLPHRVSARILKAIGVDRRPIPKGPWGFPILGKYSLLFLHLPFA